jgi:hypothetical protein
MSEEDEEKPAERKLPPRQKHLIYIKENRPRKKVTADHPVVAAAIEVLTEEGGGPLTSREIFELALEAGLLGDSQYNTLRARLSQHSGLPRRERQVVRAPGSKKIRGSRTTAWKLAGARVGKKMMREVLLRSFERTAERRSETEQRRNEQAG